MGRARRKYLSVKMWCEEMLGTDKVLVLLGGGDVRVAIMLALKDIT